jgi:hypothetical protein
VPEETLTAPRERPVGIVDCARGPVDLRSRNTIARLIRLGRARGWTGRSAPLRFDDPQAVLEQV